MQTKCFSCECLHEIEDMIDILDGVLLCQSCYDERTEQIDVACSCGSCDCDGTCDTRRDNYPYENLTTIEF